MTAPKYKIGDKVRIRKDLESGEKYGGIIYTGPMLIEGSKLGTIQTVEKVSPNNEYFAYKFENTKFYWSEEMLDHNFKKEEPTDFRVGDICEAFGVECEVININYSTDFPVRVFIKDVSSHYSFTKDGMFSRWHKTPSLKLIRRDESPKPEEKKEPETKTITRTKSTLVIDSDILEHYKQKAEENEMSLENYMNGVFRKMTEDYKEEKNNSVYEWKYKIIDSCFGEMITPFYYKSKKELKKLAWHLYSDAEISTAKRIARLKRVRGEG